MPVDPLKRLVLAAQVWACFQDPDSKRDQLIDNALLRDAREAHDKLLAAISALPMAVTVPPPSETELEAIRGRDQRAAPTWFKPQDARGFGACGQAFIDRRTLLAEIDRLTNTPAPETLE